MAQNYAGVSPGVVDYVEWRISLISGGGPGPVPPDPGGDYYTKEQINYILQDYYTKTWINMYYYDMNWINANMITMATLTNNYFDKAYINANYITGAAIDTNYYTKNWINANMITLTLLTDNYFDKSYINANYLTAGAIDADYLSKSAAQQNYYTKASADELFLTQAGAENTYLTLDVAINDYLMIGAAQQIYLSIDNAAAAYLTKDDAYETYLPKVTATTYYLTIKAAEVSYLSIADASAQYFSRSEAASSFYTKTQTDSAIAEAIANIPSGGGGGGGIKLNLSGWSNCGDLGDGNNKFYIKIIDGFVYMIESDPDNFFIQYFEQSGGFNYSPFTYINSPGTNPNLFHVNHFYVQDTENVWGWCKGFTTDNKPWILHLSMNSNSATLMEDPNFSAGWAQFIAAGAAPRTIKTVFAANGTTHSVLFFDIYGWYDFYKNDFVYIPYISHEGSPTLRCVAAGFGKFFICYAHLTDMGPDEVWFWDPSKDDGSPSRGAMLSFDLGTPVSARFVGRDLVAMLYDAGTIQIWAPGAYGYPPSVVTTVTIGGVNTWKKLQIYNNHISAIYDRALSNDAKIWTATNPRNPINPELRDLGWTDLWKSKVIADNLFLLYNRGYMEYGNGLYDMGTGTNWKGAWLPIPTNWAEPRITSGNGKIYVMSGWNVPLCADLFEGGSASWVQNTTVTHNAPLGHGMTVNDFELGGCVFMTGSVFKFNQQTRLYETTTGVVDCISSVKNSGGAREYLGICCAKIAAGDCGKNIGQDTIEFASHGDCWFKVEDSDDYEVGDVVLIDKSILGENVVITGLVRRMIVGKVCAKINKTTLALFMD
jgi:hypothetical protein